MSSLSQNLVEQTENYRFTSGMGVKNISLSKENVPTVEVKKRF